VILSPQFAGELSLGGKAGRLNRKPGKEVGGPPGARDTGARSVARWGERYEVLRLDFKKDFTQWNAREAARVSFDAARLILEYQQSR
jgi:hypothetical protein